MADLNEVEELTRDNNRMLRKLLAHQRYATIISLFKWALIIGTALGTYYFIQPYVDQILRVYETVYGTSTDFSSWLNFGSSSQAQ